MRAAIAFVAASFLACSAPRLTALDARAQLPAAEAPATCTEAGEGDDRLVVDWPLLERAKLESAAQKGLVAVRVDGCRVRMVNGCIGKKRYVYAPTTRQREVILLRDANEVSAKLPLGAARFSADVGRASQLVVGMTVVGRYEAPITVFSKADVDGECEDATHVVANVSVGSFDVSKTDATRLAGGADVMLASASGASESERSRLDHAGVEARCAEARRSDVLPPEDCGVPLRLELRKLGARAAIVSAPAPRQRPLGDAEMRYAMSMTKEEIVPCYRRALAQKVEVEGTLTLFLSVAADGHVRSVSAKHDVSDALAACAIARAATVRFPEASDAAPRVLVVPLVFSGR